MSDAKLSRDTEIKIDDLVRRAAKKAGYRDSSELSYQEHLQRKLETTRAKLDAKIKKYKNKFGIGRRDADFAEEIRTYLADGIAELMAQGKTEEEALRLTLQKFDEAELAADFDGFAGEFDGFGVEEFTYKNPWHAMNPYYHPINEAIGVLYGAFATLGLTIGALTGFFASGGIDGFMDRGWILTLIGAVTGSMIGAGMGMISHAIFLMRRKK